MESSDLTKLVTCELAPAAAVTPKLEILQYLTVDSEIFQQWRNFGQNHSLSSDSDVATFLLQHYEKSSGLPLTQCMKCNSLLTQYCIKCNIYMSQPSSSTPPLMLDTSSLSVAQDHPLSLAGNTIILDVTDVAQTVPQSQAQQIITIQMAGGADSLTKAEKGQTYMANQLEALVQACAMDQAVSSSGFHTTPQTMLTAQSSSTLPSPLTTKSRVVVGDGEPSLICNDDHQNKTMVPSNSTLDSDSDVTPNDNQTSKDLKQLNQEVQNNVKPSRAHSAEVVRNTRLSKKQNRNDSKDDLEGKIIIITDKTEAGIKNEVLGPKKQSAQGLFRDKRESPDQSHQTDPSSTSTAEGGVRKSPRKRRRKKGESDEDEFMKVIRTEKVKQKHPCELCGQELRSKYELEGHMRVHRGERPYACTHCPAAYTRPYHLKAHLRKHALIKPHKCSDCPKAFATVSELKVHRHVHSTDRPYVCEICGAASKSLHNLRHHKKTHDTSAKPFVCQLCGMTFRWRSNFQDHMKVHNDDKAFACKQCDMKYVQSGSLKRHIERKHNPNRPRPFVCEICGAARYEKTQFEKHLMIHSGVKPYKCDVCGAAFIQSNALRGHMKIHTETEGKTHWCSLCGAAFKQFGSVKVHIKKVHSEFTDLSLATVEVL